MENEIIRTDELYHKSTATPPPTNLAEILAEIEKLNRKIDLLFDIKKQNVKTSGEACDFLNISRTTLERYTDAGLLNPVVEKVGKYSRKFYRESELLALKK